MFELIGAFALASFEPMGADAQASEPVQSQMQDMAQGATSPKRPDCQSAPYRAFDFWVGDWEVYRFGTSVKVARSRIEKVAAGCALREHWMPLKGGDGVSLNSFDPTSERWHQLWIGSQPGRVFFEGGLVDGAMVLTGYWNHFGGPSKHALVRMTYSVQEAGGVRQRGEVSFDHGRSWQPSFDFLYLPKESASP